MKHTLKALGLSLVFTACSSVPEHDHDAALAAWETIPANTLVFEGYTGDRHAVAGTVAVDNVAECAMAYDHYIEYIKTEGHDPEQLEIVASCRDLKGQDVARFVGKPVRLKFMN